MYVIELVLVCMLLVVGVLCMWLISELFMLVSGSMLCRFVV